MKKCILPVILLALLSGCGKVSDASGVESRINIVSGIVEGTTRSRTTSETEAMTDGHTTGSTTSKTAGEKVSGTTTTKSKNSSVQAATRASGGNSGGSRGTTRHVPTVQRTTTTAAQPTSQTPTIDPKDYSSITFELNSSSNEIDVSREGMSGSIQVLKDVDLTEIRNTIANDPSKTINDFIVRQNDFDFDGASSTVSDLRSFPMLRKTALLSTIRRIPSTMRQRPSSGTSISSLYSEDMSTSTMTASSLRLCSMTRTVSRAQERPRTVRAILLAAKQRIRLRRTYLKAAG